MGTVAWLGGSGDLGRNAIANVASFDNGSRRYINNMFIVGQTLVKSDATARDCLSQFSLRGSDVKVTGVDYNYHQNPIGPVDAFVITVSRDLYQDGKPVATREELITSNARICYKTVVPYLVEYFKANPNSNAKIIVASNPAYSLTTFIYSLLKESGVNIAPENICGVGSRVDSDRLKYIAARFLNIDSRLISGEIVIAEHGPTLIPLFSKLKIDGEFFFDYCERVIKEKGFITGHIKATGEQYPKDRETRVERDYTSFLDLAHDIATEVRAEGFDIFNKARKSLNGPAGDICATLMDVLSNGQFSINNNQTHRRLAGVWAPGSQVYFGMPYKIDNGLILSDPDFFQNVHSYESYKSFKSTERLRAEVGKMYEAIGAYVPEIYKQISARR